ncbi:MAG: hypothetical protein ABW122_08145, partial [Ilumatobacteraceae bacterium]
MLQDPGTKSISARLWPMSLPISSVIRWASSSVCWRAFALEERLLDVVLEQVWVCRQVTEEPVPAHAEERSDGGVEGNGR